MPVQMELSRILIREMADIQIIELSEIGGERTFPIVIGLPEAFAIERRLKGIEIPRPQTHDLLASTIKFLGAQLHDIHINDLNDGTFFAQIRLKHEGEVVEIDSRPSDAIALGVSEGVPIYVAEHVLDQIEAEKGEEPPFEIDIDEDEGDW